MLHEKDTSRKSELLGLLFSKFRSSFESRDNQLPLKVLRTRGRNLLNREDKIRLMI